MLGNPVEIPQNVQPTFSYLAMSSFLCCWVRPAQLIILPFSIFTPH
nr:MAG TPA: hypothetical protein [Caudoviricetes sp.]